MRGLEPISSLSECTASTLFIKTYYGSYQFSTEVDTSEYPNGCYVSIVQIGSSFIHKGHFNVHKSGSSNDQSRAICRNAKGDQLNKKVSQICVFILRQSGYLKASYQIIPVLACTKTHVKNVATCARLKRPSTSNTNVTSCWNYCKNGFCAIVWKHDDCGCVYCDKLGACEYGSSDDWEYHENYPSPCHQG